MMVDDERVDTVRSLAARRLQHFALDRENAEISAATLSQAADLLLVASVIGSLNGK